MRKTIGQMAGRVKFTENEIAMVQGLALAACKINNDIAKKKGITFSKEDSKKIKELIFRMITKSFWNLKEKTYPNSEFPEDYFKEYAIILLNEIFSTNEGDDENEEGADS